MSTPQGMLGQNADPNASSNLYNQTMAAGANQGNPEMQEQQNTEQQPQLESLVEKATKRFGAVFTALTTLFEQYPGSDKEEQAVKDAAANWFSSTANKINESGKNSTY